MDGAPISLCCLPAPRRRSTGAAFSILDLGLVTTAPGELLICDEEVELGRRARGGDLVARDELVYRNRPFAIYFARLYGRRCRCREDDLVQAALLGLVEGANAWNPDQPPGRKFITFARYYVRMEILAFLYGRSLIRIPHSARLTELARRPVVGEVKSGWKEHRAWTVHCVARAATIVQGNDDELNHPDPSQSCPGLEDSHAEALEQLRLGFEMLPTWHAEVLRRHFGLGGRPKQSARTIARETGVSRQTVFNVQKLALERLRKTMMAAISA